MSKKSLLKQVANCKECGGAFIPQYEGDETTCDYCIAEAEILDGEQKDDL